MLLSLLLLEIFYGLVTLKTCSKLKLNIQAKIDRRTNEQTYSNGGRTNALLDNKKPNAVRKVFAGSCRGFSNFFSAKLCFGGKVGRTVTDQGKRERTEKKR